MARFVLVHGAYGGAWCWEEVSPRLESAGHDIETLDLPGAGADETPVEEITLDLCAERVCELLARREEPAILVGHSMGGVVVTQAAARRPERVASLVFVCAFMPANGQSLLDLTHLPEGKDDLIQAHLALEGEPPVAVLSEEWTAEAIYNCCAPERTAWAVARRRPQPLAPFATPVQIEDEALARIPRWYVFCGRDQAIPPALQRRMVAEHPCRKVFELDTDHAPYFSATDELVGALLEVASEP
jgi:pimeloyl-ACP methyl ester carboxylesterase